MKFNYEIWCANGPVKRWQKQKWNDLNNVGNKAKGRILKHVSQVKQAHQIFQKQTFLTPWYTNVRMYVRGGGEEIIVLRKIWRALFPWDTRFEIRPFALLPPINPTLPTYFLHVLQGQRSNAHVLIFFWIPWETENLVDDPTICG